mmetsp:Transcript_59960/g.138524  ORF Transcript_59960/g.138524 Transcript_59960/m.138524 type:complete len:188 (-) Transcript_59960:105-668(-)
MLSSDAPNLWVRNTFVCMEGPAVRFARSLSEPPRQPVYEDELPAEEPLLAATPVQASPTTVAVRKLPKGSTAESLLELVCGDRGAELCDFAFVAQDRLSDGTLRSFKFGFLNFKDPADADRLLASGLQGSDCVAEFSKVQGAEKNIENFLDRIVKRGAKLDPDPACRPWVLQGNAWVPIAVPSHLCG